MILSNSLLMDFLDFWPAKRVAHKLVRLLDGDNLGGKGFHNTQSKYILLFCIKISTTKAMH